MESGNPTSRIEVQGSSNYRTLSFDPVGESDAGIYACVVETDSYVEKKDFQVTILGKY